MELFLIRHGQSANNALADPALRVEDPLLTPVGELQAERTAAYLAARRHLHADARDGGRPIFDRLYCSPMIRAMQTARPIARALGVPYEVWVEIHEIGGIYLDRDGRKVGYAGQTRSQLLHRFPGMHAAARSVGTGLVESRFRGSARRVRQGRRGRSGAARAGRREHARRSGFARRFPQRAAQSTRRSGPQQCGVLRTSQYRNHARRSDTAGRARALPEPRRSPRRHADHLLTRRGNR